MGKHRHQWDSASIPATHLLQLLWQRLFMNRASLKKSVTLLRWTLPAAALLLSACSYLLPQPAPVKPAKFHRPAVVNTEAQQKERARQALQKATASSNEYSACVMFSTSTHRGSNASTPDIASAASANCAPKLDDYENGMATYYEESPALVSTTSAKERARVRRVELEQATRNAAVRSLGKAN